MGYIFNNGTCMKKDLYDTIVNTFITAGWKNISSEKMTDGDVLYSTGKNGDRNLYVQLLPYAAGAYGISAANGTTYSVRTLINTEFAVRLINSYTPGDTNVPGVFERPAKVCHRVSMINNAALTAPLTAFVNYDFYADKERVIIRTKMSDMYTPCSQLLYIGVPETQYVKCSGERGVVFASSCWNGGANVYCCDFPDDSMGDNGDIYALQALSLLPDKNPNIGGNFFLSDLYLGNPSVGMVSKLDGVYSLAGTNILEGDIISVGDSKFKALNIQTKWSSQSYPTNYIAIQIA